MDGFMAIRLDLRRCRELRYPLPLYPLPLRERVASYRSEAKMASRVRGWSCREAHESNPSPALASLGHPLPQGERVTEFAARRIVSLLVEYHSALMPPSFTTRSHLFISFTMCWPNSAE